MIAVPPATSLWNFAFRSGIGRLSQRADYAALAILLCFGAFANAAGMVAPVVSAERAVCEVLDWSMSGSVTTAFYGLVLIVIPAIGICIAAAFSRLHVELPIREIVCRFAWSFVPLGFAMWLAHYSFHFFTSFDTIIPATQRFAADFRLASIGKPDWICSCCRPAPDWLLKAELLSLDVGLLVSLYAAWRIAQSMARSLRQNFRVVAPWAILLVGLFACGVWILLQPMEMRGTLPVGIPQ